MNAGKGDEKRGKRKWQESRKELCERSGMSVEQ